MGGIGFDWTHLMWLTACIVVNIVIFSSTKAIGKIFINDIECQNKFKRVLNKVKYLNIILWVVIIVVVVIFFGTKKYLPPHDMGARTVQDEIKKYEIQGPKIVEEVNLKSIREKEKLIGEEIKKKQRESSESYEDFLKRTLKDIKKEKLK